jgi:hypothetical protein
MGTIALALLAFVAGPDRAVRGVVRDVSGLPVEGALVYVRGTEIATGTDRDGRFTIEVPDGHASLMVLRDGFEPAAVTIPADGALVDVALAPAALVETITVVPAEKPRAAPPEYVRTPLEIVQTPGSAADVLRALETLPGVAKVDEGAGLFVRGGDASEVRVVLDGAALEHPYRQETPGGGLFGAIGPFLFEGLSISTGGFSARHGNAMSGVLELRGLRRPVSRHLTATVGLAGASARAALPIGPRAGLRVSGNRSFPGLLFAVNGRPWRFELPGGSAAIFASVTNVLATRNFFEYAYSPDYSEQRPVTSATPRVFYFGLTMSR